MKSASVLIVDDETNIRLMLRTTLRWGGYTLTEAGNGREALRAIEREVPDVMLLDLSMPELDGMGVLESLRGVPVGKKPRVVVLTAFGSIPTAVRATRLGAIDFLEKPVTPEEVRSAVKASLNTPVARPPGDGLSDPLGGGYAAVLGRVREALRLANNTDAQTLLMKAADLGQRDAAYFNLLGVLYESQREWRLAGKFYGKAIRLDKRYEPAQQNMRRLYELNTWGRSDRAATLGDERDAWLTRFLESQAK